MGSVWSEGTPSLFFFFVFFCFSSHKYTYNTQYTRVHIQYTMLGDNTAQLIHSVVESKAYKLYVMLEVRFKV